MPCRSARHVVLDIVSSRRRAADQVVRRRWRLDEPARRSLRGCRAGDSARPDTSSALRRSTAAGTAAGRGLGTLVEMEPCLPCRRACRAALTVIERIWAGAVARPDTSSALRRRTVALTAEEVGGAILFTPHSQRRVCRVVRGYPCPCGRVASILAATLRYPSMSSIQGIPRPGGGG